MYIPIGARIIATAALEINAESINVTKYITDRYTIFSDDMCEIYIEKNK